MSVRTRFAPSPTGYMHIGGMRTALFNWLFARHHSGRFVLRIDDTDRRRNIDEALAPILRAFRWLGLDWDEGPEVGGEHGPYFQSQRGELYRRAAETLLAEGRAFRDFDPPELAAADREAAEKEKRNYLNVRRSLELSDEQVQRKLEAGEPHVVRYLMPREQNRVLRLDDAILGPVEWNVSEMPDPVIMRADGTALYNFATVVDDAAMQITHVIRAQEHLSNTPIQALLHEALGHERPVFAHVPYVAAPGTKEKLSKRESKLAKYRRNPQFKELFERGERVFPRIGLAGSDTLNPVMVAWYEEIGFLPEAVLNALARLGWSYDETTEIMDREFLIEHFTLERVIKSPAGFDPDKLMSYQQHWMGRLSVEEKTERCLPYLVKAGLVETTEGRGQEAGGRQFVAKLVTILGDRLKLFSDILDYDEYFLPDNEIAYDEKAFQKRLHKEGAAELLRKYRDRLAIADPFDAPALEAGMKSFAQEQGIKLGEIIHPVRVAVTGKPAGPGLFDCLELLGRDRCLSRIDRALSRL